MTRVTGTVPLTPAEQMAEMIADMRREIAELQRAASGRSFGTPSRRNLIDNAAFAVAQRSVNFPGITASPGNILTADRWKTEAVYAATAPVLTESRVDVITPDGLDLARRYTVTTPKAVLAADDHLFTYQYIEGNTLRACQALDGSSIAATKALALSFWCYTSVAGTYIAEIYTFNNAGAALSRISRSYVMPANTWTKIEFTVPAYTNPGSVESLEKAGMLLGFWLSAGSNWAGGSQLSTNWGIPATNTRAVGQVNLVGTNGATWHISAVQLEAGTRSTSFERLSADDDLRRCRRYFQRWAQPPLRGVIGTGTSVGRMGMALPVPMRVAPTVSYAAPLALYDGASALNVASIGANLSQNGDTVEIDVTASGAWTVTGRACVLYQVPGGGFMDFAADI